MVVVVGHIPRGTGRDVSFHSDDHRRGRACGNLVPSSRRARQRIAFAYERGGLAVHHDLSNAWSSTFMGLLADDIRDGAQKEIT